MQFLTDFTPELVVASPGRINLIGEHTDYNLGYVLPAAIARKITFNFQRNNSDDRCHIYSKQYKTGFSIDLKSVRRSAMEWENYLLGVIHEITKKTDRLRGFNCTVESDLPAGSGLSSSAALECGLAFGLNDLFGLGLSKISMVKLSQRAEHNFVGTQCGIMDQFASVMGVDGHAMLLDCRSLDHTHIPMELAPYKMVMLNTKVSHNLASSAYNIRKSECEEGVSILKAKYPEVQSLRDVNTPMLLECRDRMNTTVFNRCSFIISENDRVLAMVDALRKKDLNNIGALLYEAHEGIRTLYEVSCPESDFLVDFAKKHPEVLGARQTGGGFGGCVLHLVHEKSVTHFVESATHAYGKKFNILLEAFEVRPSRGTTITYTK
ncbi:galactokinase [Flavobacteriaceae bacterium 3-367]